MCVETKGAHTESRRLEQQSQNRPPPNQNGVSKLHTVTLVQHDVWKQAMRGYTKRTREVPPRYVPHYSCGMELHSLPVKKTVAQINCLLQYYGTTTALGTTLPAAIEHMQL